MCRRLYVQAVFNLNGNVFITEVDYHGAITIRRISTDGIILCLDLGVQASLSRSAPCCGGQAAPRFYAT